MRDLSLWRLLQSPALDPAEVAPLLRQLAGLPLQQRAAFLGLLPPLLAHPDAALRAAALAPPAGAAVAARRLVRDTSWNDWLGYLGDLLPRERDMSGSLADAMLPDWPQNLQAHYRADRLDDVMLLLWHPDPQGTIESPHGLFFDL